MKTPAIAQASLLFLCGTDDTKKHDHSAAPVAKADTPAATNLPSRDVGHMDQARFKFVDVDHLTNKWTWYKDGKEDWMEEFTFTRSK